MFFQKRVVRTRFYIYVLIGDPVDAEMKDTASLLAVNQYLNIANEGCVRTKYYEWSLISLHVYHAWSH